MPNLSGDFQAIEATLTLNDSNKFEDRWVYLKRSTFNAQRSTKCIWTDGIDKIIQLPIAHGEGKFIPRNSAVLKTLKQDGLIALEYVDENGICAGYPCNPNGSIENIAAVCDRTGRIFGLMPHPERAMFYHQNPLWQIQKIKGNLKKVGDGILLFKNAINYFRK